MLYSSVDPPCKCSEMYLIVILNPKKTKASAEERVTAQCLNYFAWVSGVHVFNMPGACVGVVYTTRCPCEQSVLLLARSKPARKQIQKLLWGISLC